MSNRRTNNSTHSTIDKSKIFAQGTFKNVWEGKYTVGSRAGQRCVSKEFKTGSVYAAEYFQGEMDIISRSQKVIDVWHDARIINRRILLNTPEVWTGVESGVKSLVEPMIENYEKFNSNTGWSGSDGGLWGKAMQALSHFSYHNSGGQFLLCDLSIEMGSEYCYFLTAFVPGICWRSHVRSGWLFQDLEDG